MNAAGTNAKATAERSLSLNPLTAVVLNQFLLIDVFLIVTNKYLVVFFMYFFAFLYSFSCHVFAQ